MYGPTSSKRPRLENGATVPPPPPSGAQPPMARYHNAAPYNRPPPPPTHLPSPANSFAQPPPPPPDNRAAPPHHRDYHHQPPPPPPPQPQQQLHPKSALPPPPHPPSLANNHQSAQHHQSAHHQSQPRQSRTSQPANDRGDRERKQPPPSHSHQHHSRPDHSRFLAVIVETNQMTQFGENFYKVITGRMSNKYVREFRFPYIHDVACYNKITKIGQGTFGEVFQARCLKSKRYVALKKILMENEKEGFPITAIREVKMLQRLKHEHITDLIEICNSRSQSSREKSNFYLVFTYCDYDLAGLLSHNSVKLQLEDVKILMKHLLSGLYKIHGANILHRDMKAANVLVSHDGILKLADFGLSRPLLKSSSKQNYTNRVVTLWYRPPELLLGSRKYGPPIDMWGAGCIMAELWTRSPILQGDTEQKQLEIIQNVCGGINTKVWPGVDELPLYKRVELRPNQQRLLRQKMGSFTTDLMALGLLDSLLTLDPSKRIDAERALDDDFFFCQPQPKTNNIKHIVELLPKNIFEFTAGRGAHANRRPQNHTQQPALNGNPVPAGRSRHAVRASNDGQLTDMIF